MDAMDLGMDLLDSHALGMGLGLAAPKKASRRDILLGRTSQAALEDEQARYGLGEGIAPGEVWQCHCCAKDNVATAAYCCCCGRGREWIWATRWHQKKEVTMHPWKCQKNQPWI